MIQLNDELITISCIYAVLPLLELLLLLGVSDDIANIKEEEKQVKTMVQTKFTHAIENSDMASVVSLCPLLQTLGLENDARDSFLDFMEKTIFVAVSADASSVDDATDPATAYAQSLSNVFNSTYTILQQYLSMVIQGMENSLGDIYFIRKLHARCEQESGLVLKRYLKIYNTYIHIHVSC